MLKKLVWVTALLILVGSGCVSAQSKIEFHVPVFPPYTFEKDGKIQGIGVERVSQILDDAGLEYTLKLVSNYGRCVADVRGGLADGFFLASQNAERDKIAVFSNTVMINRWCWFLPTDSTLNPTGPDFKSQARVGTYLNTNTEKWLRKNKYHVAGNPSQIDALIKMLKNNRINCIFLAEHVFYDALNQLGGKADDYRKIIEAAKPFGIYISKTYLSENPGVIEKINAAITKIADEE